MSKITHQNPLSRALNHTRLHCLNQFTEILSDETDGNIALRIKHFRINGVAGIELVDVSDLADIVVLAGPNGVGKTRIITQLLAAFRKPAANKNVRLVIEATAPHERAEWGKNELDTDVPNDSTLLQNRLRKNQRRSKYGSTVLNFESDRTITKVEPYAFNWDVTDPFDEEVGWDTSLGFLRDRFSDVQHSLFRLVEAQKRKIADKAISMQAAGQDSMKLNFPDPLEPFREAFSRLLAPKTLIDLDIRSQRIRYELDGEARELSTLSSGEREVVNIAFDFLLRRPSDCIIFFDEPELHLHPELSYRLLQTLSSIGQNNQFIFCTHSPEIITASIDNSVIFISPKSVPGKNQAISVSREDETHHALNLLGQSIGIISLGKKILLIEGDEASLDKQTYGAILKNEFPELVLVPVGGKSSIKSFDEIYSSVVDRTIWGVDFFMLCDRDAQHMMGPKSVSSKASDRLKLLPRYHLENYFLDSSVLAKVFREMEADKSSWLCDESLIEDQLKELAKATIPYAVALSASAFVREAVGNVDIMPKNLGATVESLLDAFKMRLPLERARISSGLDEGAVEDFVRLEFARLTELVDGSRGWRVDLPGRVVLNRFSAKAKMPVGRMKTLYLRHAEAGDNDPFGEVRTIFRSFRDFTRPTAGGENRPNPPLDTLPHPPLPIPS